jgi:hypothetical protein
MYLLYATGLGMMVSRHDIVNNSESNDGRDDAEGGRQGEKV